MKQFSQTLKFLTILVGLFPIISFSQIREFQTTRLKSTAGAGAASLLIDEASVLNPAPLAFFNVSSFYFQKTDGENSYDPTVSRADLESDQMAFIASDSQNSVKGSVSYIKQSEGLNKRQTIGASLATPVSKKSAWGVTYKRISSETANLNGEVTSEENNQFTTGVLHAISPELTLGVVIIDPFGTIEGDRKGIIGFQYLFQDMVTLMLDGGADYKTEMSDTFLYRTALQVKFYNNFYIRAGYFNDKGLSKKGTGTGISWVQPKLMLDIALSNVDYLEDINLNQDSSTEKETSFSVSYRF